ncbi:hypothetical protein F2Q68_00044727 [Brassica cretica]|uniref:Uncharacterized protein n=1 Tax=Brassica cretica TaxID=69181 RepID=A0A8S9LHE9_BRACR|nr:hypothetical protein F2Q68_00044727 [Brassica cretica]
MKGRSSPSQLIHLSHLHTTENHKQATTQPLSLNTFCKPVKKDFSFFFALFVFGFRINSLDLPPSWIVSSVSIFASLLRLQFSDSIFCPGLHVSRVILIVFFFSVNSSRFLIWVYIPVKRVVFLIVFNYFFSSSSSFAFPFRLASMAVHTVRLPATQLHNGISGNLSPTNHNLRTTAVSYPYWQHSKKAINMTNTAL